MAIFREFHKDSAVHYHAAVVLASKSRRAWEFDGEMYRKYDAETFTEIVIGGSHKPHLRVLEYLMCPTPKKPEVGDAPYFTKNFDIPETLWDKAAKLKTRLANTPSSLDEIYAFLVGNPSIDSYEALESLLDTGDNKKLDIKMARISKFINNNIGRAKDLIGGLVSRRDRPKMQMEARKTPMDYLEECIRGCSKCVCPIGGGLKTLEAAVDFLVNFHMPANVNPFFEWADKFIGGE